MPAKSRAQFRLMEGIKSGSIPPKGGLTKSKAAEYVSGQSPAGLPERKSKTEYDGRKRPAGQFPPPPPKRRGAGVFARTGSTYVPVQSPGDSGNTSIGYDGTRRGSKKKHR